ncbi:MAG: hypothetical protein ACR2OV_05360 [Hyphomicrobiaceae bacterium]
MREVLLDADLELGDFAATKPRWPFKWATQGSVDAGLPQAVGADQSIRRAGAQRAHVPDPRNHADQTGLNLLSEFNWQSVAYRAARRLGRKMPRAAGALSP